MGYTSTTWVDDDGSGTVGTLITAAKLNNIESALTALASRTIVNALPGSPADGDVCYFQNTGMATAGVVWQLRYRSGGGTYKWEYLGGPPLYSEVLTSEAIASGTYAALATAGPSITTPLAGDYMVGIGCYSLNNTAGGQTMMSYDIGATGAVDADYMIVASAAANAVCMESRERLKTGLGASIALTAKYKNFLGTATFANRWMTLSPVRVG